MNDKHLRGYLSFETLCPQNNKNERQYRDPDSVHEFRIFKLFIHKLHSLLVTKSSTSPQS